jgi:hypothetical protein
VEDQDPRLRELLDKQEIHDRHMRYIRGVDRGDGELISQAFHPDAIADHGQFVFSGKDIGEIVPRLESQVSTGMHFLGNELIEVDGDEACVETYFLTFAEVDRDGRTYLLSRGSRYVDLWERRDGRWGITYRKIVVDWGNMEPISERWPGWDRLHFGARGQDDAVFRVKELAAEARASLEPEGEEMIEAFAGRMAAAGFAGDGPEAA